RVSARSTTTRTGGVASRARARVAARSARPRRRVGLPLAALARASARSGRNRPHARSEKSFRTLYQLDLSSIIALGRGRFFPAAPGSFFADLLLPCQISPA